MIVSAESKTGQTHSRVRHRRRGGESDARSREAVVVQQNPVVMSGAISGAASTIVPIVVDDEDDDVVLSSPTAFAQARLIANAESRRSTRQTREPVEEDPLELRLGTGAFSIRSVPSAQPSGTHHRQGRQVRADRSTIDLTTPSRPAPVNEDCVLLIGNPKSRKRKDAPVEQTFMREISPVKPAIEKEEEHKFKCAICMDIMKAETSTICGHIFCQACIQGAIRSQKKCPTCRRKLTMKNVHRIYL